MIKGIYGVNVAVNDLAEATKMYEAFLGIQAKPISSDFFAVPGLVGSHFRINGFHLNLVASTTDGTSVAKFLARRGEGLFLLSVEVDDMDGDVANVRELGATVLLDKNAEGIFGSVNFVHPKSMAGVQIEIYQPSTAMNELSNS